MYVPGKIKNCDKVLVDVGTGYYVEKVHTATIAVVDLLLSNVKLFV